MMFNHPGTLIPELLGRLDIFPILVIAERGFRHDLTGYGLRAAKQSKFHCNLSGSFIDRNLTQ